MSIYNDIQATNSTFQFKAFLTDLRYNFFNKTRFKAREIAIVGVKVIGFGSQLSQIKLKTFFWIDTKHSIEATKTARSSVGPLDSWLNGP